MSAPEFVDRSIPNVEPGSAEWYTYVTASKIAAIVGHSGYDSWFSLWHRMNGTVPADPDNDVKRRGHYVEPAIKSWFGDQFPEFEVRATGLWIHPDAEWAGASPDGILIPRDGGDPALLECKSDGYGDPEWGDEGSGDIPRGYFDQVQWQMACSGIHTTYVAVLQPYLTFAWFKVEFDAAYAAWLLIEAEKFMVALTTGIKPSVDPLDGHTATYASLKALNPLIDPQQDVVLTDEEVIPFLIANDEYLRAETQLQAAKNVIAERLGNGKKATWNSHTIATRQQKAAGLPYMVKAKKLPSAPTELESRIAA